MRLSTGGGSGAPPPQGQTTHTPKTKKNSPPRKNEIFNREPKRRGPAQVHKLFLPSYPHHPFHRPNTKREPWRHALNVGWGCWLALPGGNGGGGGGGRGPKWGAWPIHCTHPPTTNPHQKFSSGEKCRGAANSSRIVGTQPFGGWGGGGGLRPTHLRTGKLHSAMAWP